MPDNVDKLFEIMQAKGAASDRDKFRKVFLTPGNKGYKIRKDIYDGLRADGIIDSPTYEDFRRKLRLGGTPTVNKYRQQMFNSVDPNKSRASELTHRAVGQAVRATNNVRKPVTAKVLNRKGKPTGNEFAITPAKTVEDLDREYAQAVSKNWENELHDQMADADKDAAKISDMFKSFIGSTDEVGSVWGNMTRGGGIAGTPHSVTTNNGILENTKARQILAAGDYNRKRRELLQLEQDSRLSKDTSLLGGVKKAYNDIKNGEFSKSVKDLVYGAGFDDHSFFRGMYDAAKDTGFLTSGASDLINAGSLLATKQDLDNGIHTETGDMLMQQAVKNSNAQSQYGDNHGWMYTGGVITTNMAPFMVQIGSAGFSKGMSTSIGKVVQGAASKVALGTMEKATGIAGAHIANYIGKVTGLTTKTFGKAIQYGIVGASQANTVGLGNVANDVINRYTGQVYQDEQGNYKFGTFDSDGKLVHEGGEDFLTALVKGEAAQTIEFATELAGGGIDAAGTALKNFVTKGGKKIINKYNMENVSKVIDFLLNNKVSKNARYLKAGADRTLGKVEVNSIVGESLEEELGIIANTVFTGDNKISDLWDEKQQSQIWGGMLLSIGLMKGAVAPFHAYNAKQYYSYKHKLDKADVNLSQLLGKEKWEELRNQIDATTNDDMPEMVNKINRDVALGKNRQPVREYIQNLLIMRGYDIGNMLAAKKAVEDKGEGVSVKNMEKNQAYQQGRDAYGYDTHEIQLDQEDKQKSLAQLLGISEQQLASMSDEELEALSGRDDNIDRAIYDYQLSTARYEGVIDNARDQIDLEVQRATQAVDMYTDKSRNTIRNATIKATGGLEDYGVYIINGNIATHEDGSIDISNSDDMILYYDPTTNTVEHADAMMFAELGSEENADEVRSQAMADAKEKAIKETTGIIDGVVEVGTQFKTVDADGTEHTYEVLADNGDGTAMITIDGNIPTQLVKGENVQIPVSFEELQKMKDASDQQRLQAAKAQREQLEKERAERQKQAQTEETQPSFDFTQILNDNGNVVIVDVIGKDGNTKYPNSKLFLIRDSGAKAKVVELKSDGSLVPHAVNKKDVAIGSSMTLDEYKQAVLGSSMIEDNSGSIEADRGGIEVEDNEEGKLLNRNDDGAQTEQNQPSASVTTSQEDAAGSSESKDTNISANGNENNESLTFEDGTPIPVDVSGETDLNQTDASHAAEWYDNNLGEDADDWLDGEIKKAKKVLEQAKNKKVTGTKPSELVASKKEKEAAIADAKAHYDSAISIRDSLKERRIAKEENTSDGRRNLIEKARRKFARLKSAVKDDAEAVAQIYKETVGTLLHRLYDGTGIDVTDTIPLTAEEYVASNLGAHSLNYEGTETSKGVKQDTGLSREDFAKTQLLAAGSKGTTIDNLVHSLWENRPSNLDSLDTQDIRNAMLSVITSGFKASEARNYIENLRIAQAENILEEQKKAADNAAFAEGQKAKQEEEEKKAEENAEENSDEINDEENEKINEQTNENINAPEVPEDATEENPLGLQLSEDKVPFEIEGGKSGETYNINDNEDRQRLINDNKVDDKDILDIDMPKHVHKAIKELCKKMGLKVQFLYMGARSNGWIENGTMYLALDTEKATQFVFGHEMTHAIKQKNPEAYKELVKVAMAVTTRKKFEEDLVKVYQNYYGISGYNNVDDYVEEVVADNLGKFINDFDLAQKFSLRLNHPVLATILHAIQKIKSLLYGDFYKSVDALERIVEKAYVDTAKGEVTNSETGEDVSFSLRQKPEPKKKGIGYKVFVLKDGKLYPPMVANPDGAATPVGVWLDADAAPIAGESKTGRPQVKQGGKGTQGGSGKLAYRPGWHLGVVPYAIQFNRKDAEGNKTLFPKNFVFAEVEYAADVDYQEEARQEGINPSGKYQHSLAGLKHLPTDGYYMYRTNPNPETDPWVITGAMKVNRILTRAEQAELVKNAGREPQQIQEGDIVTDDVVNSINQEIAAAPKFSLKVYHGSGADFTEFDFDHMGEGAGSQVFGWGGYVTSSKKIGKNYATLMDNDPSKAYYRIQRSNGTRFAKKYPTLESFLHGDKQIAMNDKFTEQEKIDYYNEMKKLAEPYHNLYEVDIPEDNGSNYLDWDKTLSKKQQDAIREGLVRLGVDMKKLEGKGQSLEKTGENVYNSTLYIGLTGTEYDSPERTKGISKFLSSVGFTGIKYKAGRNFGGAKKGDTNYVIFKPEDMKITEHTKFSLRLKSAIKETDTNPSDAQKESGNYKKGHIKFGGYDYTIENPKGSTRSGKDADGKEWKVTMHDTYGYIRGKFGKDGDHLDMFINDKADLDNWNGDVFVVDQVNPDGSFDEHKVMYGYDSMDAAKKAYLANYSKGWQGLGNITGVSKDEFDKWLDTSKRKLKPFKDYAKVKFSLKEDGLTPEIANTPVNIVDADEEHGFKNYAEAREWAKKNIVRTYNDEETGGKGEINISNTAVGKYLSEKSVKKSANKDVHMSVLKVLPSILRESVDAIQHVDRNKVGNERSEDFGVNPDVMIHRCYGAVNIGDKVYGVKITLKENVRTHEKTKLYSYEATKIELLDGQSGDVAMTSPRNSNNSITVAKIIKGFETAKKNGEKFSLKDEKTMFGMHNISVDKLRKAIKQGGFAAPSMGVVDSKNGIYSDYGEITLIPKAEKLAKRTGKNAGTFTADSWTPTYPQVERIMNKQGEKAFNTDMNVKLGDVDNGIYSNVRESWKGYLSRGDVRDGLYWHYLFDKGMNPETIYQTGKYDNDITNEVMRISDNGNKTDYTDKEVAELIQLMNKATGKDNDVDAQREKLKARIASAEKQGNHLLVALKKKRLEELEGVENFYIAADFVNDVVRNNRKNGKVDVHDTMGAAKKKVEDNKKLSDDFPSWLDKKTEEYGVEEMLYNGTTPSGKPKYIPNTIDNAVKLMKKQGVAGGYTAFGSELGVFIAKNSPEVNTLAAMKNAKDKLIPFGDERHNQIKDKITKEFLELSDEIRVGSNNRYAFDDSGVSRMVELTDHKGNEKEYLKKAYNVEVSDEWMDRYNKLLDTIKKDYKVFYFETKFMRPYGLDEFEKAIVPNDTPSDVVDALKNAGIDVSSYERGNTEDRQKVTMDAINSSDNIRFSLAGERGAAAADKAEERTFRMDNLSVARKMEEEKKDAKAIKMATGWERGADGKWRYEMPDVKIKDTMDVGGGHIVKRYEDDMLWNGGKLSRVIDAPELFKAYPQLKDVRIDTDAIMNDMPSNGEYNSKTNTITIHADELKYMNSILNHEIQHVIQDIEGFAKGGSPRLVRGEVNNRFDEVTKQIKQLRAEGKEDEAKALIEKNRGLYNAYQKNDDFNSYKSLAGEVEARNVSARLNMTPEERRKSLAESTEDVARKDQIFLGVGDVTFSLRDMADGKESGAADMAEDLKSLNTPDEVDDAIKTAIEDMPSGWQMANRKMIHIAQALGENRKAEIAGEESKFSLKDGTLIKAGTYFSGGGLVEEGLKGIIDPVVAVEYDEKISGVYRNNFGQHIVTADVRDVDPKELVKQIDGEVEYFHVSPVCKNYSQAKSNHAEVELDKETAASTAEFINAVKPKVVTIENVKGYKDSEAMKIITDALDANGYTWDADVYNAADFGGYTNRERLIVRAVRDGQLPAKPEKMARKSGWYEAVADIIPTLTEKKNGVANWMDIRLKADGIDCRNIDKPLYVMGSAYADGKVPHAFADELLPTLRTKSGDVIVMPDGKVYRAMGRVLARVSGVSDDYKMPFSENLSHTIIGNGIPTQLTEHVIAPLLTGSDPKFSIRTYHGTGAKFDKFDLSHSFEGEGSETFGHGVYVTNSKEIGSNYAQRAKDRKGKFGIDYKIDMSADAGQMLSHYINKYQNVDKGLENARQDLKSALEMFPDDETLKELSAILQKRNDEIAEVSNEAYRYDVDIPDDNGENYLGWNESQNFPLEKWYRLLEITHHGFNENEYFKDGGANYDKDRIERIIQMKLDSPENGMQKLPTLKGEELYHALEDFFDRERPLRGAKLASRALSEIGFVGIKYPAGMIHGGAEEGDYNYVIFDENNANIVGNTRFSLRYDQFEHDLNQWKKDNNLPKDAQRPTIPQRNAGESAVDFLRRVDEYRKQMALWKTAPTYEQHLLSDDTALGEFNRELQRGSVLKRIAFQDSMLAIRKAQEAIMKEVGVDRLNMAEDAYTAENRSHGKGKNEFEEYNNEFLQPLRKVYHQMKKILGDSYDNVRIYMMAKHGLERDAQMAFKKSLDADFEDVAQRSAAYRAYKGDMNRITNDSDLEFGRVDFTTWRQRDNALRTKYSPSYMDFRYDENGIAYDYSGLSALFSGSDFEEAAHKLVRDIESSHVAEVQDLWNATNAATKKILRDGYKAGMMSKDTYLYVRDMYSHYIPLRGWDGTTADQVWDYVGGGKGAFNQTLKTAHGRTSIADDPIAYIENMAESGILLNNKNWVKQHLMLLAQNHPTSLLTLSKAWYVKSTDANGNEEWIPATPQITSQMNSNQVKTAIDAFEQKMENMAQTGDATQQRDGLNIAYPQTHSEEREHEVRVMKDGEEYVIYVNGDPQLAQAMNNTRAHRVSEGIKNSISKRVIAVVGRKMAAAYTSLSPLFIPSNYFRDLTMTLASTAIREDGRYNYLLRKNLATSWNLGFMLKDYQNGKLREKVSNGNATPKEQMFYDFMMNGGETGFVSSLDVEDLKKKFKNDLKDLDRWKTNPVKVGHTIMDSIEFLNRAIEDSNRFAVYMTSIQYGRSIDEAVNDAKDVTLNFNRKGTGEHSWQTIRNLYLFINPAVQSLQTLGALAKHHPFKFTAVTASWIASGVLVPIVNAALMQMAAAFLGGDGDDDKDWYKDISKKYWQFSKWDRRNNFIMWVPTTHEFVKIPLAQEFRAFYGVGDMIASKMMGGELAEESWSQYAEDLLGQVVDMLPLDPTGYDGNIAVSLMPNAIRPVFELAFNVDFTGKPLFKETEYNKYDPNFTKAYVGTPDWLVRASKMVNSIGNDYPDVQQNSIDAFGDPRYNLNNPAVVDHVLSSYLGGAYTMGSQVLGVLTKSLNDPKEIKMADIPLFSKFVSNPDDRPVTKKQGDEFWDMKENHDRAANTLSKLKKQAKVDGDYSLLERFYGSEEYKKYKQDDVKVKKYEEDKKKERAEESGEEYRPHKLNAEDIYKAHATPKDDFEDLKLKQLYTKLNGFKSAYDLLVDTAPSQSDGYYNTNKAAIDAIDEISLDKQEISELKKGFLDDGKDAYNAEDMKQIRELRKKILAVLEKANKVVVANQKAKAEK
jgi:site-specific DNA-cytosine methylase